jgi:heat shock protein HslJ/uncharacterized lipoprotein YbaY
MMRLLVVAASLAVLAGCASDPGASLSSPETGQAEPLRIKGALTYRERIALAPQSRAQIELREGATGEGAVVAEQAIELGGRKVPIPFELAVSRDKLVAGRQYSLLGQIAAKAGPSWTSQQISVDTAATSIDLGTRVLLQARHYVSPVRLRCGEQFVSVAYSQDPVRMIVGGEAFELRAVPAASGAKYEASSDPSTTLWNKGASSRVVVRGKAYPECSPAAGEVFSARGNEPGWMLRISGTEITLETDYGQKRVTAPRPEPETTAEFRRYAARTPDGELAVTIFDKPCRDSMSGMPYPHSISVLVDGRTLQGCGGDPATLLHGAWVVEEIDSTGIIEGSQPTLNFSAEGRVSGKASCNSYTGKYVLSGEALRIGPTAATTMACEPRLMQQEQAFLARLEAIRRFELAADGTLLLISEEPRSIRARRM